MPTLGPGYHLCYHQSFLAKLIAIVNKLFDRLAVYLNGRTRYMCHRLVVGAVLPLTYRSALELRSRQLLPVTPRAPSPVVQSDNDGSSPVGAVRSPAPR